MSTKMEVSNKTPSPKDMDNLNMNPRPKILLIVRVLTVYLAMMNLGMVFALMGGLLLELGKQTNADVEQMSLLVTSMFTGAFSGSLLITVIFERLQPEFTLGVSSIVFSISLITLPFVTCYGALGIVVFVMGCTFSIQITGGVSNIFRLFKHSNRLGSLVQGCYFTISIGNVIGPLTIKPFIEGNGNTTNTSTVDDLKNTGIINPILFYPFLLTSICSGLTMMLYVTLFILDNSKVRTHPEEVVNKNASEGSLKEDVILMMCAVAGFCSAGVEVSFCQLLYVYAVQGLGWDAQTANTLLTVLFASMMTSRGLGIPAVHLINPAILWGSLIILTIAMLALLSALSHITVVVWISVAGMGVALANLSGLVQLTGDMYFNSTGKIVGLLHSSIHMGCLAVPGIAGYIFKAKGINYLPYLLIVPASVLLISFVSILIYGRQSKRAPRARRGTLNLSIMREITGTPRSSPAIRLRSVSLLQSPLIRSSFCLDDKDSTTWSSTG